jgi:hypothetical protein
MQTNIGLQAFWKSLQHGVHIDTIGVGPRMLEILFQTLPQWIWNLKFWGDTM